VEITKNLIFELKNGVRVKESYEKSSKNGFRDEKSCQKDGEKHSSRRSEEKVPRMSLSSLSFVLPSGVLSQRVRDSQKSEDSKRGKEREFNLNSETSSDSDSNAKIFLTQKVLDFWNSRENLVSHVRKGTVVRNKSLRVLRRTLRSGKFSAQEIMEAIENFDFMLEHSSEYRVPKKCNVCLGDFIEPGSVDRFKKDAKVWLVPCLRKNAPLTSLKWRPTLRIKDDPNPNLTKLFVTARNQIHCKSKFLLTNLSSTQQKNLASVIGKLGVLASCQNGHGTNGHGFETSFINVTRHCLEAADHFFSTWPGMEEGGVITPGMLKTKRFWMSEFPHYEKENHSVNGISFPRAFYEKCG
jgi:hypothetical protein